MFTPKIFAGICLVGSAIAQTSTFFSPGVPTDAPIPGKTLSNLTAKPLDQSLQRIGNYTGQYRPRVHFSPPQVSTMGYALWLSLQMLSADIVVTEIHERSQWHVRRRKWHLALVLSIQPDWHYCWQPTLGTCCESGY